MLRTSWNWQEETGKSLAGKDLRRSVWRVVLCCLLWMSLMQGGFGQGGAIVSVTGSPEVSWRAAFAGVAGMPGSLDGGITETGNSAARFNGPSGMVVGADGVAYVADTNNHVIRRIMPDGAVDTYAGVPGMPGYSDSFTEKQTSAVQGGVGTAILTLTGGQTASALLITPGTQVQGVGIATGTKVLSVSATGLELTLSQNIVSPLTGIYVFRNKAQVMFNRPRGLALDATGNLYVADTDNHAIRRISVDRTVTTLVGAIGVAQAGYADGAFGVSRLNQPHGVAVLPGGTEPALLVADTANHLIRKVSLATGNYVSTVAGTISGGNGVQGFFNGLGDVAKFGFPKALVAVEESGQFVFYVADSGNHAIRKLVGDSNLNTVQVTTLAGGTAATPNGAGYLDGPFAGAKFNGPAGIAAMGASVLLVTETDNHTVRRLDLMNSVVSTSGGQSITPGSMDGVGTASRFNIPTGIAVAPTGRIYVANVGSHVVSAGQMAAPEQSGYLWSVFAGSTGGPGVSDGGGGVSRFTAPQGMARNPLTDEVYVIDGQAIRKISPNGQTVLFAGVPGEKGFADSVTGSLSAMRGKFNNPAALVVDSTGIVYVADAGNNAIRKVDAMGVVSTIPISGLNSPSGIAVGTEGQAGLILWVADTLNQRILKLLPSGTLLASQTISKVPGALAVRNNDLFFTAPNDHQILKLNLQNFSAEPQVVAGSDAAGAGFLNSTDPLQAEFNNPSALQVDADGAIYVVDNGNHCIRRIGSNGVTTFAGIPEQPGFSDGSGTGGASGTGAAKFFAPGGLVLLPGPVGGVARLRVADTGNFCIREVVVDAGRKVSTIAGAPALRGNANGAAIGPRFQTPYGVAADGNGNVYVLDRENHVIRRIKDGQVTTFAGSFGQSGFADGLGTSARFSAPNGLAVDGSGNVYVADSENHAIRKVTPAGDVSTLAGQGPDSAGDTNGPKEDATFDGPLGVAVDKFGNLYVADTNNFLIRKLDKSTGYAVTSVAGISGVQGSDDGDLEFATFSYPRAVSVSADGAVIYVGDETGDSGRIRKIDTANNQVGMLTELPFLLAAETESPYFPFITINRPVSSIGGVAVDASGAVLFSGFYDGAVYRVDGFGSRVQIGGALGSGGVASGEPGNRGGLGTESRFIGAASVAVAPDGMIYVVNSFAASVLRATPPSVQAPALNSPVSDAVLSEAFELAFHLPEPVRTGSLQVQFKNAAVTRVLVLDASQETVGGHVLSILASQPERALGVASVQPTGSKIPSGIYSIQVSYINLAGQNRKSAVAERVVLDASTQAPVLTSPASKGIFTNSVRVSFTLPEPAASGSAKLIFDDGLNPRVLVLAGSQETAGPHSFDLNPSNPAGSGFVVNGSVVPPGLYEVRLEYQDQNLNAPASVRSSGVIIRGTAPELVLPQSNSGSRAPVIVQFSLPARAKAGSLRLRFTDSVSSQVRELVLGSVLEGIGGRFEFDPAAPAASSAAVVSGPAIPDGVYSVQLSYQDSTGARSTNLATQVRIDTVTLAPTFSSFTELSTGLANLGFSLPEPAKPGSVMVGFRPSGGSGMVPKIVLANQYESAGTYTATVDLLNPESDSTQVLAGEPVPNGTYDLVLSYSDLLDNPRAFDVRKGVEVTKGAELVPLRFSYGRQGSGTPFIFTFRLFNQASTPIVRLEFEEDQTGLVYELVLSRSFANGEESVVGFDPFNTALGGNFLSAPSTIPAGTYKVKLRYMKSDSSVVESRQLTGVRVPEVAVSGKKPEQQVTGVLKGNAATQLANNGGLGVEDSTFQGFTVLRFGVPSAIGDGGMAYQAICVDSKGRRVRAVFVSDSVDPVAIQGVDAPGAGVPYLLFGTPVVNRSGDLAFSALLDAEDPESGLWVRRSGVLGLVFRQSQPVGGAGGDEVLLDGVTNIALADNGDLFFTALRTEPLPEGADPDAEDLTPKVFSLWRQNSNGQLAELLSTGSMVAVGGGESREVKLIQAFGSMPDSPDQRRGYNKDGVLVARAEFTDGSGALVKFESGTVEPVVLLKTGAQTLGGDAVNVESMGLVSMGDDGNMVVRIGLLKDGAVVTADNAQMLVKISSTGEVTVLSRTGQTVSVDGVSKLLKTVGSPTGGHGGAYAVLGSVSAVVGEGEPAVPAELAILRDDGDGFSVLAKKGAEAPGVLGSQFNQFRSLAWTGNGGLYGPAFVASLKLGVGQVNPRNDVGLWAQDSGGAVQLLLREGDVLNLGGASKVVRLFSVLSAVSGSASHGHSTVGEGTFAVRVVFTDLTEAVVNVSVP